LLFNIAQFPDVLLFPHDPKSQLTSEFPITTFAQACFARNYSQKMDRAAFTGGPSQGGNARGRAATGGLSLVAILQMETSDALTNLNFDQAYHQRACFKANSHSNRMRERIALTELVRNVG
jgi:hypothetical protein